MSDYPAWQENWKRRAALHKRSLGNICFCAALLAAALAPCLAAQSGPVAPSPGAIAGELRDLRQVTRSFEPDTWVVALALPRESPPFCEVVSAAWQDAFTDIAEGRDPHGKLGGLASGVQAREGYRIEATADGRFELRNLPLKRRLALAARVQGLWRPVTEEIWLTEEKPRVERVIDFYTLGADVKQLRVAEHTLEIKSVLREDLKYAPVTVIETLVIENPDQRLAALPAESVKGSPFIELELLAAPTLPDKALLASLYGTELLFCQGVAAKDPRPVPPDERANSPWMFGGVDTMHGKSTQYSDAPQISLDAWHPLNLDGALEFIAEGETFFRLKQDAADQNAAFLVFNRPVPPGENGRPGRLVIRLLHKSGVLYSQPSGSISLARVFSAPVADLRVTAFGGLEVAAVKVGGHSGLLREPEVGADGLARYAPVEHSGNLLEAGERYVLALRFDREAQKSLAEVAKIARPAPGAQAAPAAQKVLNVSAIYGALAAMFGLGFIITLLLTFRASREVQRRRVNEAHVGKNDVLQALAELDRDFEARKVPASSYLEQRKRLLSRAVDMESRKGQRS